MGIKRILLGEDMPDKNDPKYKARYEQDVEAGRKFAKALHLDKCASAIQQYASTNRNTFLVIVFVFVFISIALNIYRMTRAYSNFGQRSTAVESQERSLKKAESTNGKTLDIKEYQRLNTEQ